MILPIVAYGDPVLRKTGVDLKPEHPELDTLLANMFETMYHAQGVGLAAPQVGLALRLFIIDATPFAEDDELDEEEKAVLSNFKKVFINARILEETGDKWSFNEGCLSIPDIREDVSRHEEVRLEYYDENFERKEEVFSGLAARVIQHEYDHIEGVLFTDKLSSLKKRLLKGKLANISKGKVRVDYKMKFPLAKKGR